MKRSILLVVTMLALAACGDDDAAPTTTATGGDSSTTTTAPGSTTTVPATTTTGAPFAGATDCLEIWPETAVQAVAGTTYTFFAANPDRSACTYMEIPNGIALGWRTEDADGFGLSRTGAESVSGVEDVVGVCDAAFVTTVQEAILVMEAYSAGQGRAYTATLSGIDLDDARAWAASLLDSAC